MATYTVKDKETGNVVTFKWTGADPPTDEDMSQIFADAKNVKAPQEAPQVKAEEPPDPALIQAIGNIPQSAANFGKNLLNPILHPIDTATGLYNVAAGTAQKLMPGARGDKEAYPEAVVDFFRQRYGGIENFKKTLIEDPVGSLADISSLFSLGGGILGRAGSLSPVIGKAGSALSTVGNITNPVRAMGSVAKPIVKGAGTITSNILGRTTGTGAEAVRAAWKGGDAFTDALRGKVSTEDVLSIVKDSVNELRDVRGQEYRSALQQIAQQRGVVIDPMPVYTKLANTLNNYRVYKNAKGEWSFDQSTIDRGARAGIKELIEDVEGWKDFSPLGMDALKQRVDDFYAPTKNTTALVSEIRNSIKNEISTAIPEYERMTRQYSQATQTINEIDRALSTGKKANIDTALRKLGTIFRDVNDYRRSQVEKLSGLTGNADIMPLLAGTSMNPMMPRGYLSTMLPMGGIGVAGLYNPKAWAALPAFSPRVVGETSNALGKTSRALSSVAPSSNMGLAGYQAGRVLDPQLWEYIKGEEFETNPFKSPKWNE